MKATKTHSTFPRFTLVEELITIEGTTALTYGVKRGDEVHHDISTEKEEVEFFMALLNEAGDIDFDCIGGMVQVFLDRP